MKIFSRYYFIAPLILIALLILPAITFANTSDVNTDIEVSNNGANSQNNVSVTTNTGGNYINGQEVSNGSGHTHIEVNGKTYDYDNANHVSVQDDNGNTNVTVNGQQSNNTEKNDDISTTPDVDKQISQTQKQIADAKSQVDQDKQNADKKVQAQKNAIQQLIQKIQDFFKNLKLF
jgi:hypothetical protein